MMHDAAAMHRAMQAVGVSQLAILLILMSCFPGPELRVFTATMLGNATTVAVDVEAYGPGPLYLATSGVTAAFAAASGRLDGVVGDARYCAETLQEVGSWDMAFWASALLHHALLISFMCTPCDWYFLILTAGGTTLLVMLLARQPLVDPSRSRDYVLQFAVFGMAFMLYTAVRQHDHVGYLAGMLLMNGLVLVGHAYEADVTMATVINSRLCYCAGMSAMMLASYAAAV
jgi:hypothetical protein